MAKVDPIWPRDHISWSQYHVFHDQGPREYAKKYLFCPLCGNLFLFKRTCPNCGEVPEYTNARMQTGKMVASMLEHDTPQESRLMEHLRVFLPRYEYQEFKMETTFNGVKILSFLDGFDEPKKCECQPEHAVLGCPYHSTRNPNGRIGEYKTGVKWTQKMADETRQLDFYVLQAYLRYGVKPEDIPIELVWMPTEWPQGDMLPRPTGDIVIFKTRRTTRDCLNIGKELWTTWGQIGAYCGKVVAEQG